MNPAIFSLIGLVVGAILQFLFTRHLDSVKHQRDLRTKAYADYLLCVSENANLGHKKNTPEARELAAKIADAKARIALYGNSAVVSAFAAFERLDANINSDEQAQCFVEMVSAMREDSLGHSSISHADLEAVLLGVRRDRTPPKD